MSKYMTDRYDCDYKNMVATCYMAILEGAYTEMGPFMKYCTARGWWSCCFQPVN